MKITKEICFLDGPRLEFIILCIIYTFLLQFITFHTKQFPAIIKKNNSLNQYLLEKISKSFEKLTNSQQSHL